MAGTEGFQTERDPNVFRPRCCYSSPCSTDDLKAMSNCRPAAVASLLHLDRAKP